MKLDILAFGAHPDDVEMSCGGTLIRHIRQGKKVGIIDLTHGELSTRGNVESRKKEAEEATKALGLTIRETLNFSDGFVQNEMKYQLDVIKLIRRYQPDIILCNAIDDRHPDHGKASKVVSDCCFLAGLIKIETLDNNVKQAHWRLKAVYHYIQDRPIKPDFVVDITEVMEERTKVILAYKSQFFNPDTKEPETPISTKIFQEYLYAKASTMGRSIGVRYAEGFTVERTPGVNSLFDLL